MKIRIIILSLCLVCTSAITISCRGSAEEGLPGDLILEVETGKEWIHDFSFMIKTPPQYAIWTEDVTGEFLSTVFVTRKAATEGWVFNKGNRRIESLPLWMHKRNIKDEHGVLLPSEKAPLTDGITGATPKGDQRILFQMVSGIEQFKIVLEINQSTDFNEFWPENAAESDEKWSGGKEGSGQPALVYSVMVNINEPGPWILELEGRSSADGTDGDIYSDTSGHTTSKKILGSAIVTRLP